MIVYQLVFSVRHHTPLNFPISLDVYADCLHTKMYAKLHDYSCFSNNYALLNADLD